MIGAWAMQATADQLAIAKRCGIGRIDLMVNDHAADRAPTRFRCMKEARDRAKRVTDAGFELHLTSWIMPHLAFAEEAADSMQQLAIDTGACSVLWDAEEPWTQATGKPDYHAACCTIVGALKGCRWGVTGIGFAPWPVLDLAEFADYVVPQAYVTEDSQLRHGGIDTVLRRWAATQKQVIPGLAAYNQGRGYIATARSAAEAAGFTGAIYWSLRHIESSKSVQAALRSLADGETQ